MKNEFKNVIILGELDYFIVTRFGADNDSNYKAYEYNDEILPISQNEDGASTINALHVINNVLEEIDNLKAANGGVLKEVCYFAIPDKINTAINRGTYKGWIKNHGFASSGKKYSNTEIEEWLRFDLLYKKLFSDVNFRGIAYFSMSKPKYNIDNVNKNKRLIRLMKKKIEEHKEDAIAEILI